MLRRFLSRAEFDSLPKKEIIKWCSLEVGAVFRVLDVNEIPTRGKTSVGVYAVLETEKGETIHAWITSIIRGELRKYDITRGSVFVKPLGTKRSSTTGKEYFNFAVGDNVKNT